MRGVRAVQASFRRCYSLEVEMALAALILLAWQVVRIPLEGSVATSLAHARSVLRLEQLIRVEVEHDLVRLASSSGLDGFLDWAYGEIHVPALFAFLAAARLVAPSRYPQLRTIFLLSFVPAIVVIAVYPLAPPHWLPEFGFGLAPAQDDLSANTATLFQNSTAAAASQHFGFAIFIAAGSLWLAPCSPIAKATLVYPILVFVVIVGTGNHYVFDCAVGTATFAFGVAAAALIHRGPRPSPVDMRPPRIAALAVLGFTMVASGAESLESLGLGDWKRFFPRGIVLMAGVAVVLVTRQLQGGGLRTAELRPTELGTARTSDLMPR